MLWCCVWISSESWREKVKPQTWQTFHDFQNIKLKLIQAFQTHTSWKFVKFSSEIFALKRVILSRKNYFDSLWDDYRNISFKRSTLLYVSPFIFFFLLWNFREIREMFDVKFPLIVISNLLKKLSQIWIFRNKLFTTHDYLVQIWPVQVSIYCTHYLLSVLSNMFIWKPSYLWRVFWRWMSFWLYIFWKSREFGTYNHLIEHTFQLICSKWQRKLTGLYSLTKWTDSVVNYICHLDLIIGKYALTSKHFWLYFEYVFLLYSLHSILPCNDEAHFRHWPTHDTHAKSGWRKNAYSNKTIVYNIFNIQKWFEKP